MFKSSIELLGFQLDEKGLHPAASKVLAIKNAPRPMNITELRSFVGLVNFDHKFVNMSVDLLEPLYNLTRKNVTWSWSKEADEAFNKAKSTICEDFLLVLYDPAKELILTTDSSSYGVGATLAHPIDGVERPIAFASTTLSEAEKNHSQTDKEALAIIFGVKYYHNYLAGRTSSW